MLLAIAVGAAYLLAASQASNASAPEGLDPINNYCARFDHQSTLKDNILYIDGGTETFVADNEDGWAKGDVTIGNNNYLITVDMTKSWDWRQQNNITESFMNRTVNPKTGTSPPQVVRGSLFSGTPDDSKIYLYGGTTSFRNVSFPDFQGPSSDQYTLWSYDTKSSTWDQYDVRDDAPVRVNSGASAEALDQGLAFFFNGQIDNGSSLGTGYLKDVQQFMGGMVILDTKTQTAKNISTEGATGNQPVSRGKMAYVPDVGNKGALVLIGGSSKKADERDSSDIGELAPMDSVTVFDLASKDSDEPAWYQQATSGDVPSGRVDHCVVVASAPDGSSHQITVYGGRSGDATLIDDVWTLSIPAFRWTKLYSGSSPRYGHTCHVVGNRQMLAVGGTTQPDFNLGGGCDWESKGVAIWDMSTRQWGQVFDANAAQYTVPEYVVADIGGDGSGSANFTRPVNDFSSAGLAKVFNMTLKVTNSTSSGDVNETRHGSRISGGAIAGIVIGSLVCLGLIAVGIYSRYFRHRQRVTRPESGYLPEMATHEVQEKDDTTYTPASRSDALSGPRVELDDERLGAAAYDEKPLPPEPSYIRARKVAELGPHAEPSELE